MKVTVCIGSSCHLKGSRQIVEQLQSLIAATKSEDKVELNGAFCMGKCVSGVSVTVDGVYYSVQPENTKSFFEKEIAGISGKPDRAFRDAPEKTAESL
ncbi:MAG: (2Fe-2S) ferredoxin domain-containing protein [Spirochaetaceae bacterium]|jgi:NADH:ubiquinone oxidoreductase subunit E|nr:(2Fe-2S) ferredoxin domain-containing protein [Spirochaetaceae bacterium]